MSTPFNERYVENPETGCWDWTMSTDDRGYGYINPGTNVSPVPAYRWAYEKLVGPIPDGLVIDHLCCNTGCINPDHLEPVTQAENCRRGENTKLTEDDVREIRRLREEGNTLQSIADEYDIHNSHVWRICAYEKWADVA